MKIFLVFLERNGEIWLRIGNRKYWFEFYKKMPFENLNKQNSSNKNQIKFGYTSKFDMLSVLFIVIMFGYK
jgi:hypothetical protein